MRARRALPVVGVPLTLAQLVAARPIGQPNAVVPFSQSSAEFAQARRADRLRSWTTAPSAAHLALAWRRGAGGRSNPAILPRGRQLSEVAHMTQLFFKADSFNEDIGAWDTSGVRPMMVDVRERLGPRPVTSAGAWRRPISASPRSREPKCEATWERRRRGRRDRHIAVSCLISNVRGHS